MYFLHSSTYKNIKSMKEVAETGNYASFNFRATMNFNLLAFSHSISSIRGLAEEARLTGTVKVLDQSVCHLPSYLLLIFPFQTMVTVVNSHMSCAYFNTLQITQILSRIFNYLFLVLLSEIANHGSNGGHMHIRIYVPDIVDHHVHTKTVYLHLHKPPQKKPKKTHHKQYHQANWSSWSSYGHHHGYKDEHNKYEHSDGEGDHGNRENLDLKHLGEQKIPENSQKYFPLQDYHKDSYFPQQYEDNNLEQDPEDREGGKNRYYAVHEDVKDIPPNAEAFSYKYEEGYRKGLHSESGHVHADQSSKFHEDQHEEQDDMENDGLKDNFDGKTDAGRYLVDDVEYENTRDKREGRRRIRRVHGVLIGVEECEVERASFRNIHIKLFLLRYVNKYKQQYSDLTIVNKNKLTNNRDESTPREHTSQTKNVVQGMGVLIGPLKLDDMFHTSLSLNASFNL
ncbi:uncharacterized protein LOC143188328 [Calliopsis andreniformis]|uniref:uncharacterized protein LOC143188328 n=1 Tax=Calliopsis andreniformis TaxID=337506 RepID=UPI003FCC4C1B